MCDREETSDEQRKTPRQAFGCEGDLKGVKTRAWLSGLALLSQNGHSHHMTGDRDRDHQDAGKPSGSVVT